MIAPSNPLEAWRALVESRAEGNRVQIIDSMNHLGEIYVRIQDEGDPGSRASFSLSPEDAERLMFLLRCALMNQKGAP